MTEHIINKSNIDGISYGFFSNQGGISDGIYASLNCGSGSNDSRDNVEENRFRVADIVSGKRETPLLSCYQIHSNTVVEASSNWGETRPKADAMVTAKPDLILGILTADCTPVLFADPVARIVGAAHAGWKGALGGILANTVAAMEALGSKRQNIAAMVGPTIHQASYEVGAEFRANFLSRDKAHASFFTEGDNPDHFQFDLPGFVEQCLNRADIKSVSNVGIDTYSSQAHFSYRRTTHRHEDDYGRQVSAIMLKD